MSLGTPSSYAPENVRWPVGHDVVQFGVVPGHAVQFYETEEFLVESVGRFLSAGLHAAQPLLVIARGARLQAVRTELGMAGFDIEAAEQQAGVTLIDARDMLAQV